MTDGRQVDGEEGLGGAGLRRRHSGGAGVGKKFFLSEQARRGESERERWEDGGATSCLTDALTTVFICKRLLRQDGGCFLLKSHSLLCSCHAAPGFLHSFFIILPVMSVRRYSCQSSNKKRKCFPRCSDVVFKIRRSDFKRNRFCRNCREKANIWVFKQWLVDSCCPATDGVAADRGDDAIGRQPQRSGVKL